MNLDLPLTKKEIFSWKIELDEQQRYLLFTKLEKRKIFSSSNKAIVERLNVATHELLGQIEGYLEEE